MLSWEKKRQVCRTFKQPRKINNTALLCLVTGLSFLCTFVPGSEKTIERTFAPVELSFRGTFAPGERKVQELSFHGTFAPVELSLLRSECSMFQELSFHGTFAPLELSLLRSECSKNFRSVSTLCCTN